MVLRGVAIFLDDRHGKIARLAYWDELQGGQESWSDTPKPFSCSPDLDKWILLIT